MLFADSGLILVIEKNWRHKDNKLIISFAWRTKNGEGEFGTKCKKIGISQ